MSLGALIDDEAVSIDAIGQHLDALDHAARKAALMALSSKQVRALYWRAASAGPLTLDHFVPPGTPPLQEVIHWGRNSLPTFNFFQKRFTRAEAGAGRLFGYNEQSMRWATGPGYFVCRDSDPGTEERGAVVIDYFLVPDAAQPVPEGWPKVVPNSRGIQILIYHKTRDYMRRVSEHTSVGAAFRGDSTKEMGAYFLLCRDA